MAIAICLTAALGVFVFRRELLAFGDAIAAGVLALKARLKEIEDDLSRR